MIFIISKKFALSMVLIALMGSSLVFAQTNSESGVVYSDEDDSIANSPRIIDYIDHNGGRLSLDDQVYRLKLNAKVYDARKKLVNRYALKKGQRVFVEVSGDRSERYIDSVFILGK
jgi:hypothetical protein